MGIGPRGSLSVLARGDDSDNSDTTSPMSQRRCMLVLSTSSGTLQVTSQPHGVRGGSRLKM